MPAKKNTICFRGRTFDIDEILERSGYRITPSVARPLLEAIFAQLETSGGRDLVDALSSIRRQAEVAIEATFPGSLALTREHRRQQADAATRRARRIPAAIKKQVLERDAYRCRRCGNHLDLTLDHIIPIKKGGKTEPDNLQSLCRECNSKKGDWYPAVNPHA